MFTINIIGYGFVGSAIGSLLNKNNIKYNIYDTKYIPVESHSRSEYIPVESHSRSEYICSANSIQDLVFRSEKNNKDNIYFISVPTPSDNDGNCDISIVENVLKELSQTINKDSSYIIIKSTLVPGSCKTFSQMFPKLNIIFCPEFLRELTANDDIYNAKFVLCSHTSHEIDLKIDLFFKFIYNHNPDIQIIFNTYEECELFKYTLNVYFAVKVWYFNEIYEICDKIGVDYQSLKKLFKLDSRIGEYGTKIPGDDGFGFGKPCLPKEIKGMMKFQEKNKIPNDVLSNIINRNSYFRLKKL